VDASFRWNHDNGVKYQLRITVSVTAALDMHMHSPSIDYPLHTFILQNIHCHLPNTSAHDMVTAKSWNASPCGLQSMASLSILGGHSLHPQRTMHVSMHRQNHQCTSTLTIQW